MTAIRRGAGQGGRHPHQPALAEGASPTVSVVLPCLNEAGSVELVVRQARAAFDSAGLHGEVVVADNGSTDGSQLLAEQAGARVVQQPVRGYGAALMAGIAAARGDVVVMADADATYPFERLAELLRPLVSEEADMVVGNRWCGASAKTMPFLHRFVGTPILTWLVRRAGGPAGLTDSQSGFRAFRRDAISRLGLRSTGMEFASEMLVLAGRAGWRVVEIDAGYHERIGESKLDTFSDGWRHLKTIVTLAPDLLATYPGAALLSTGLAISTLAFMTRDALQTGSVFWQMSLMAPVLMIIGAQALLGGLVLSARSPLRPRTGRPAHGNALRPAVILGSWLSGVGAAIQLALLLGWAFQLGAPLRGLQLAGLAQSMLVVGMSMLWLALITGISTVGYERWQHSSNPATGVAPATDPLMEQRVS